LWCNKIDELSILINELLSKQLKLRKSKKAVVSLNISVKNFV
jgi:hypothetical protein